MESNVKFVGFCSFVVFGGFTATKQRRCVTFLRAWFCLTRNKELVSVSGLWRRWGLDFYWRGLLQASRWYHSWGAREIWEGKKWTKIVARRWTKVVDREWIAKGNFLFLLLSLFMCICEIKWWGNVGLFLCWFQRKKNEAMWCGTVWIKSESGILYSWKWCMT